MKRFKVDTIENKRRRIQGSHSHTYKSTPWDFQKFKKHNNLKVIWTNVSFRSIEMIPTFLYFFLNGKALKNLHVQKYKYLLNFLRNYFYNFGGKNTCAVSRSIWSKQNPQTEPF